MKRKYRVGDVLRVIGGTCMPGVQLGDEDTYHYFADGAMIVVTAFNEYATDPENDYMVCEPLDKTGSAWVDGEDMDTQYMRECDVELGPPREFPTVTDVEAFLGAP